MWIKAFYNIIKEKFSEFSLWVLLPVWLKRFILDVDLEHIRLKNMAIATTATGGR